MELRIRRVLRNVNPTFLFLVLFLLFINVPLLLDSNYLPLSDTFQTFAGFHYFYSHFFHFGELPKWSLYSTYGVPTAFWQLIYLTPSSYVVMFVGRLLHIEQALLLWKLTVVLDQTVFLLGLYLLCRLLYQNEWISLFVCAGAVGCTVIYGQIWWNFRIYYLLPLIFYFILLFFLRSRTRYLWLAGTTFVVWFIGNLPYFVVIWVLVLLIFTAALSIGYWKSWKSLLRMSRIDWAALSLFGVVALIVVGFAWFTLHDVVLTRVGRDPDTQATSLNLFLVTGGQTNPSLLVSMFVRGVPVHTPWSGAPDNTVYIGLLMLPLLAYAALKVRTIQFLSLAVVGVFLLWLSAAGSLAAEVYLIPGVNLFRHLGLVFGLLKIILILCAGFGLQWVIEHDQVRYVVFITLVLLFLADYNRSFNLGGATPPEFPSTYPYVADGSAVLYSVGTRIVVYALLAVLIVILPSVSGAVVDWLHRNKSELWIDKKTLQRTILLGGLLVAYLVDMWSFQSLATSELFTYVKTSMQPLSAFSIGNVPFPNELLTYVKTSMQPLSVFSIGNVPFPSVRETSTSDNISTVLNMTTFLAKGLDRILYNYVEYDPCVSRIQFVVQPVGLAQLLAVRNITGNNASPTDDVHLGRVMGCGISKFRLISTPIFAESPEQAWQIIKDTKNLDDVAVLTGASPAEQSAAPTGPALPNIGSVELDHASANEVVLKTTVNADKSVWLVYADSFHPGWSATVNGMDTPIALAYQLFKAVPIPPGQSIVRFSFDRGLEPVLVDLLALLGASVSLSTVFLFFRLLFNKPVRHLADASNDQVRNA